MLHNKNPNNLYYQSLLAASLLKKSNNRQKILDNFFEKESLLAHLKTPIDAATVKTLKAPVSVFDRIHPSWLDYFLEKNSKNTALFDRGPAALQQGGCLDNTPFDRGSTAQQAGGCSYWGENDNKSETSSRLLHNRPPVKGGKNISPHALRARIPLQGGNTISTQAQIRESPVLLSIFLQKFRCFYSFPLSKDTNFQSWIGLASCAFQKELQQLALLSLALACRRFSKKIAIALLRNLKKEEQSFFVRAYSIKADVSLKWAQAVLHIFAQLDFQIPALGAVWLGFYSQSGPLKRCFYYMVPRSLSHAYLRGVRQKDKVLAVYDKWVNLHRA